MRITQLWCYPVKSLQGTPAPTVTIGAQGIVGDRAFALRDVATGALLTGRRDPVLLHATAVVGADGRVALVLPDGTRTCDDAVLSAWVGRPVQLVAGDAFHDSTRVQISIVATGDLGGWDVRRFRPNVVVQAATVDHLAGTTVRIGSAEVEVVTPIDRCVMVTRPQPGGIAEDRAVLRTIHRQRGSTLAVGGLVRRRGSAAVGDRLTGT